jgi:hypothetical protein
MCTIVHQRIDIKSNKQYGQANWTIQKDQYGTVDLDLVLFKQLDGKIMVISALTL